MVSSLGFKVKDFNVRDSNEIRHILVGKDGYTPITSASIYENHLFHKSSSFNSRRNNLSHLRYLYSWGNESQLDVDNIFLSGSVLTPYHIRSFASWLRSTLHPGAREVPPDKRLHFNSIITTCASASTWFYENFSEQISIKDGSWISEVESAVSYQKQLWREVKLKVTKSDSAPDLSNDEVTIIEQFLKPENRRKSVGIDIAVRDYLIWRMVIEFGMRIGEVLAIRLEDCPSKGAPYFQIVRIEERDSDYRDPRKNPPRPKTLSRDLGFLLENTVFPRLVSDYVTANRYKWALVKGRRIKKFILPHKFLITSRNGNPLSMASATAIAKTISNETGIEFHWHLARHAFFNRAYAAVALTKDKKDKEVRIADLVVWGGWQDEDSLKIYSARARKERARLALSTWQNRGSKWTALD